MKPQLILIAGPYRSGTNGNPDRIADNLLRLERAAWAVYQRGHMPMIAEWVSLPLARMAGSVRIGDAVSEAFLYPVAHRMIQQCDSILRIDGESNGADADVNAARELGLPVYYCVDDIPAAVARSCSIE
ncbi:DUF4406 domain-containing protein [Paraburkholderia phenoliruptrix]|uniref:DUF4406 domain-containing protein n=1 Tax=Paraburkholderia phenoliruptrix TaxID=252970 RepID=A0ABV3WAP9_9BURK